MRHQGVVLTRSWYIILKVMVYPSFLYSLSMPSPGTGSVFSYYHRVNTLTEIDVLPTAKHVHERLATALVSWGQDCMVENRILKVVGVLNEYHPGGDDRISHGIDNQRQPRRNVVMESATKDDDEHVPDGRWDENAIGVVPKETQAWRCVHGIRTRQGDLKS